MNLPVDNSLPAYRWQGGNLVLDIHVQPGASGDDYAGEHNQRIKLKIKAPPVDGKANTHLLRFLGKLFGVPQSRVRLLQGAGSRQKRVEIENPQKLPPWISPPPPR